MSQKKKSTTVAATSPSEHTGVGSRRPHHIRRIQNFLLVWLDSTIDEINNQDCINTITNLREVVNTVNTFTDVNECLNFIKNITEEKTFMISSGALGQTVVPIVHDMPQVSTIYIFCGNKTRHEQWTKQWSKVKGVFTDIKPICEALKQAAQICDQNNISMSFVAPTSGTTNQNLNELDQSFMYTQILKEILLTIDFEQQHINDFILYCREQFIGNTKELKNVDKLEREYHKHVPIWWYTYHCFLHSMLNRALRTMEVDLIVNMGFFVRDLHKQIEQLHLKQYAGHTHSDTFIVYRGQGLIHTDFDQLVKIRGGLLSFNNFLSTSMKRQVSLDFIHETIETTDLIGILFVMTIDPSISSTPFANVRDVSYFQSEEEVLFSMHSIFRIEQTKQIDGNNRLWQVALTLTSDNDPQLYALTERIREESFPKEKGWYRLGQLLLKLGQFDKAQQVYEAMLDQSLDEGKKGNIYHQLGSTKDNQGKYVEALAFYEKALEIQQKTLSSNHPNLAHSYNNIGSVYEKMDEYSKALSSHEKALGIRQKTLPPNHPDLATSYNNIGSVYDKMGEYSKALSSHEKAFEIYQKTLPPNHPDLATSYNNIGSVYDKMGEYSKALLSHERALNIGQLSLPANHPNLQTYKKWIEFIKKKL
jgi:tetratricopeptide (TPR) repeat protein